MGAHPLHPPLLLYLNNQHSIEYVGEMCETSEIASLRKYIFKGKDLLYFIKKIIVSVKKKDDLTFRGTGLWLCKSASFHFRFVAPKNTSKTLNSQFARKTEIT